MSVAPRTERSQVHNALAEATCASYDHFVSRNLLAFCSFFLELLAHFLLMSSIAI